MPVPAQMEDLGKDTAKRSSCTPSGEALQKTKEAYLFISDISVKLHGLHILLLQMKAPGSGAASSTETSAMVNN